jgi:hypothetical protein
MKRLVLALLLVASCGTVPAPTPEPVPGPVPDPEPAPVVDYSAVCQHLADLGCKEGRAPNCAEAFGRIQGGRISDLQPTCLMAAKTAAAARACGSITCP